MNNKHIHHSKRAVLRNTTIRQTTTTLREPCILDFESIRFNLFQTNNIYNFDLTILRKRRLVILIRFFLIILIRIVHAMVLARPIFWRTMYYAIMFSFVMIFGLRAPLRFILSSYAYCLLLRSSSSFLLHLLQFHGVCFHNLFVIIQSKSAGVCDDDASLLLWWCAVVVAAVTT